MRHSTDAYGRSEGGAWLLAVTRHRVRVFTMPDGRHLGPALAHFEGLLAARDGREAAAGRVLHEQLLAPVVAALPAAVSRVVMLRDGVLHRLPVAALAAMAAPPTRTWSSAPSASWWLRWRSREPAGSAAPKHDAAVSGVPADAWVVAAPDAAGVEPAPSTGWPALPGARDEAAMIRRRLGERARVLLGKAATEAAVKEAAGARLLHVAAHARVADAATPGGGIVLAPTRNEDGMLSADEIARLDVVGSLVVLATCRSEAGRLGDGRAVPFADAAAASRRVTRLTARALGLLVLVVLGGWTWAQRGRGRTTE